MSDERELRNALEKAQSALKKTRSELEQAQDDQSKSEDELEATRRKLREAQERERALEADFERLKREAKELEKRPAPAPAAPRSRRSVSSDFLARAAIGGLAVFIGGLGVRAFMMDAAGLGAALVGAAAVLAFNARRD